MIELAERYFEQPHGHVLRVTYDGPLLALMRCPGCSWIVGILTGPMQAQFTGMRTSRWSEHILMLAVEGSEAKPGQVPEKCPECPIWLSAGDIKLQKL